MNKKIFTLLLLAFVLISMSAISATDIHDNNNATLAADSSSVPAAVSDDSNVLGISNDDKIQSASDTGSDILAADAGSLNDLKQDVSGGGSKTLDKNYQYVDNDPKYIIIDQDTTIDGAGYTIDLGGKASLFTVTGGTLTLKNLIVTNGVQSDNTYGIGVITAKSGNMVIDNCTFIDNKGDLETICGGGVSYSNYGITRVTNSKFINNVVSQSILGLAWGNGFSISNNVFIGNTAPKGISQDYSAEGWTFSNNVIIDNSKNIITIDNYATSVVNNYWGSNTASSDDCLDLGSWGEFGSFSIAKMTATYPEDDPLEEAKEIEISFDKTLPEFNLDVSAVPSNAVLNTTNVTLGGGKTARILITPKAEGQSTFTLGSNLRTPLDTHVFNSAGEPKEKVNIEWVNETVEMYQGDDKVLSVIVKNSTTNEPLADIAVTFKLNTDSNEITTGSDGIAVYDLNALSPTTYTVNVHVDTENLTSDTLESQLIVKALKQINWYYGNGLINENTVIELPYGTSCITNLWVDSSVEELPEGLEIVVTIGNATINAQTYDIYGDYDVPLTGIYPGTYDMTFNSEGYLGTKATFKLNAMETNLALDGAYTHEYGNPITLTATVTNGAQEPIDEGSVSFYVNGALNKTVDVVNGGQAVLDLGILPIGNYTVVANYSHPSGIYKNSTSGEKKFSINKATTTINVDSDSLDLKVNEEINADATLTPADAGNLTYSSSDESVATVDDNGMITGVGEGTANITVSFAGNENYTAADDVVISVSVSLTEAYWYYVLSDKAPELDGAEITLNVGDGFPPCYAEDEYGSYLPNCQPVKVQFNETCIIDTTVYDDVGSFSVDISGVNPGTYTVTFSSPGYTTATATVTIKLKDASVSAEGMELKVGENGTVSYVTDPEGLNVTFVSDESGVYSIDENGVVTALKNGTGSIIVKVGGDGVYAENSTVITVTVSLNDADWTYIDFIWGEEHNLDGATLMLPLNYSPICFVKDADGIGLPAGTNITVFCNGDENYTINSVVQDDGQFSVDISDIALGTYEVTFSAGDAYTTATATVTIVKGLTEINVENETVSLKVGEEVGSGATLTPADAGNLTYTSSNESVAVVVDGKIKAIAAGTATITVSFAGNDRYYAAGNQTIEVTVSLNDAKWTYKDIYSAEEHELDGATLMLPWNYSPTCFVKDANGTGLPAGTNITIFCKGDKNYTINSVVQDDGQFSVDVSDIALGKYKVTFSAGDAYTTATATVYIVKALTEITVENETVSLKAGEEVGSGATLTPADAGNLTYTSSNESVAVVVDGKIKAIAAGTATITVSFAGNDRYYAAGNQTIEVTVSLNDAKWTYKDIYSAEEHELNGATLMLPWNYSPECFVKDAEGTGLPAGTNITIFCKGDENYTLNSVVQDDGQFSVDVSDIELGKYKVTFSAGDAYTTATATVYIVKALTEITVENETVSLKAGKEVASGATLTPADAGNLTYTSSNESVAVVVDGKIKAIAAGTATITVSFSGNDRYYAAGNQTIEVTVSLNDASVSAEDMELKVGDNGTISYITVPDGLNVSFVPDDSGVVSVADDGTVTALKEGTAFITINVGDNEKYALNSTVVTVVVSLNDASVSAEDMELTIGETGVIDYTTIPDGLNVTFVADNSGVVDVSDDGTVTALKAGTVQITINVGDGKKYAVNSTVITVTVSKIPTEILIQNDTLDMAIDDVVDPVVSLMPSNAGNLSFKVSDNSVILVNDQGVVTAVGEGNATVTVSFEGNDKYLPSNATITVNVKLKDASVTADRESLDLLVGEEGKFYTETAPEDLDIMVSSSNESVATVKLVNRVPTVTSVGEGNAVITVTINEDKYVKNSTTVAVKVVKIPTEILIQNHTLDMKVDDVVDPVVSLMPSNAGNLSFKVSDNSVILVNDQGVVTAVGEGNATVTVSFEGDYKYLPSNATITVTVSKIPTEIGVDPASLDLVVGNESAIAATLTPADAGNVTFTSSDDSVVTVDEEGNVVAVGEGTATITVSFAGDDKYAAAENVTVSVSVAPKPKENATISIDAPSEATEGDNVTVTVTLPEDATGTVTIGNEAVPVVNGTASAVLTNLPLGNTTVPITYSGDDKYNPIETGVNISVKEVTSVIVSAPDVTKYYGGSERFVVTVTDNKGNPLANKTVIININGRDYTRTTDANGNASMAIGLPSKVYNVTVTVDNQTVKSVVTVLATVNGTDVVKMYRNGTQYYATFLDSEGKYLTDGTEVQFNINGVMYNRKVSGDKGLARLNINLPAGEYIITAMNPKTGEKAANNITVLPTIVENKDITKYYKNATQYTVKVLGADGKPVGANETVTFNINGVMYTRTTNASGIAKLNINLVPGDYVITAEYNGYKVANNITVLPVLSAKDITMKYRDGTKFVATLVDGQGKPYEKQTVQFNINGVLYSRLTDASGQAKLNINLMAGEYIITSSYNGANIANKITITA